MISPYAVEDFLKRSLRDSAKYKRMSPEKIDILYNKYVGKVRTKLAPRHWQKVAAILCCKYKRYLNLMDMGLGKALQVDEQVITPIGLKRIGDVRVGDYLLGSDGENCKVLGVYPQGTRQTFRVHFRDGTSSVCTDDHLWNVNSPVRKKRNQPCLTKSLKEIRSDLHDKAGNCKWYIPFLSKPAQFAELQAPLPLDAYTLGVLLGNGCFGTTQNTVSLSTCESHIWDKVWESLKSLDIKFRKRVKRAVNPNTGVCSTSTDWVFSHKTIKHPRVPSELAQIIINLQLFHPLS